MLGDLAIVVAHHHDIVRYSEAQLMQRFIAADRHQIIGGEDQSARRGSSSARAAS